MDENSEHLSTRRDSLVKAGGLLVAAIGAKSVLTGGAAAATEGTGPAAVSSGALTCVLTPELTEGPYYLPGEKVRRNITEGRPGTPLVLKLKVVNASTCRAIKGAAVDIWHADAGGTYSGVQGSTGTFMRGIQPTDAKGVAQFLTVYPGWYRGRAVHIHVKVHLGGNVVHTGQLFFSDSLTDTVYKAAPYNTRGARDTRNASDSIFVNGGKLSMLALGRSGSGYAGSIAMGVHRS
jgi:protocatechuate 3,4-dioxygenase beta subunit